MTDTSTIALDPQTVSEYDFVLAIDASGSMAGSSTRYPGKSLWEEGQEFALGLAGILEKYDDDGIDVITFGGTNVRVFEGVTGAKVAEIFRTVSPYGGTPTDQLVTKIAERQRARGKKAVAIILTDGAPSSPGATVQALIAASNGLGADEDLTFLFVQVGQDPGITAYLQQLDDGLQAKGAKFDIVDTVSGADAENIDPLELVNKAIND